MRPSSDDVPPARESVPPGRTAPLLLALAIGFAGVVFICFFTYWYEVLVHGGMPQVVVFSLTPVVLFLIFLLAGIVNPLLRRLLPALALGRLELVIILSMWLVAGAVCFRNLTVAALSTVGNVQNPQIETPTMKQARFGSYVNSRLFLSPEEAKDYYDGKSEGTSWILPFARSPLLRASDIKDPVGLAGQSASGRTQDPLSAHLWGQFSPEDRRTLMEYAPASQALQGVLAEELSRIIRGSPLYDKNLFAKAALSGETRALAEGKPQGEELVRLNRLLLEEIYPGEIARWTTGAPILFQPADIQGVVGLAAKLHRGKDPLSRDIRGRLPENVREGLDNFTRASEAVKELLVGRMNKVLEGPCVYRRDRFASLAPGDLTRLMNRLLLEAAYPQEISRALIPVPWAFRADELKDAGGLAARLRTGRDPVSEFLRGQLSPDAEKSLDAYVRLAQDLGVPAEKAQIAHAQKQAQTAAQKAVLKDINRLLQGPCLYEKERFGEAALAEKTRRQLEQKPRGEELLRLNRTLLEEAYPGEISARMGNRSPLLRAQDIKDFPLFSAKLKTAQEPLSRYLWGQLSRQTRESVERGLQLSDLLKMSDSAEKTLVNTLNGALQGPCLYENPAFGRVKLNGKDTALVNRLLLQEAYGAWIASLAPSVPWALWWRPLLFWVPFMLAIVALSWSLVRMMHTEWSRHELLTYPIAEVADSLVSHRAGRAFPDIFYGKVFWVGFTLTALLYLINGLRSWFPLMVQIPIVFEQRDLLKQFPFLYNYCGTEAYSLFRGWAWPFMVALAVLMPTEISLTCWLGYVLAIFAGGSYFVFTGLAVTPDDQVSAKAGMCIAMVLVILYLGRKEYARILRLAFGLESSRDELLRAAARFCRLYLACFVALTGLLIYSGLDWLVSLLLVVSFSFVVILVARFTAEVGLPWLSGFVGAAQFLPLKLLGTAAVGPTSLAAMAVVGSVLDFDTSNTVAAQATTYGKLAEKPMASRGRFLLRAMLPAALCVAIGATIFFTLWNSYSFRGRTDDGTWSSVRANMDRASSEINRLHIEGTAEKLDRARGFSKLAHIKLEKSFWEFFAYGAFAIVACSFLRLRFSWWPFHPLPLLLVNTWNLSRLYHSCLVGWAIKVALVKIGGGEFYSRSKSFFIGVICGGIVMAGLLIGVEVIYYLHVGRRPPYFSYFT